MEQMPFIPMQNDKDASDYSPYKDPTSFFYGLDENFVPTEARPLQQVRCAHISGDGEMCEDKGVMGTGYAGVKPLCAVHGGKTDSVQVRAKDIVEAARLMLTSSVPSAMDSLLRLATDRSVASNVQLAAIKDILDRAGVKHDTTQKIEVEITQSPSDKIAEKLASLRPKEVEEEILEDLGEQQDV